MFERHGQPDAPQRCEEVREQGQRVDPRIHELDETRARPLIRRPPPCQIDARRQRVRGVQVAAHAGKQIGGHVDGWRRRRIARQLLFEHAGLGDQQGLNGLAQPIVPIDAGKSSIEAIL